VAAVKTAGGGRKSTREASLAAPTGAATKGAAKRQFEAIPA